MRSASTPMKGMVSICTRPVEEFKKPAWVIDRFSLRMISGSRVGRNVEWMSLKKWPAESRAS